MDDAITRDRSYPVHHVTDDGKKVDDIHNADVILLVLVGQVETTYFIPANKAIRQSIFLSFGTKVPKEHL